MSEFKVKCTGITQGMTSRVKRDGSGGAVKDERGITVYEQCPRWSFTFAMCGTSARHGTFNLQTTDPEEAAKYRLDAAYTLALS